MPTDKSHTPADASSKQAGEAMYLAWPPYDRAEDQFRQKVQSKMTVATLLGGFAFAMLIELIKEEKNFSRLKSLNAFMLDALSGEPRRELPHIGWNALPSAWDMIMPAAALCLMLAVILFISTIYSYDNLMMPFIRWKEVTWKEDRRTETALLDKATINNVINSKNKKVDGKNVSLGCQVNYMEVPVCWFNDRILYYMHGFMVRTWRNGFSLAVLFSTLRIFLIVLHSGAYVMPMLFLLVAIVGIAWMRLCVRPRVRLSD